MTLTEKMQTALTLMLSNGAVHAGGGNKLRNGGVTTVNASTIRALAARGIGSLQLSPDGGMMLRSKVTNRDVRAQYDASQGVGYLNAKEEGLLVDEAETFSHTYAIDAVALAFNLTTEEVRTVIEVLS